MDHRGFALFDQLGSLGYLNGIRDHVDALWPHPTFDHGIPHGGRMRHYRRSARKYEVLGYTETPAHPRTSMFQVGRSSQLLHETAHVIHETLAASCRRH